MFELPWVAVVSSLGLSDFVRGKGLVDAPEVRAVTEYIERLLISLWLTNLVVVSILHVGRGCTKLIAR